MVRSLIRPATGLNTTSHAFGSSTSSPATDATTRERVGQVRAAAEVPARCRKRRSTASRARNRTALGPTTGPRQECETFSPLLADPTVGFGSSPVRDLTRRARAGTVPFSITKSPSSAGTPAGYASMRMPSVPGRPADSQARTWATSSSATASLPYPSTHTSPSTELSSATPSSPRIPAVATDSGARSGAWPSSGFDAPAFSDSEHQRGSRTASHRVSPSNSCVRGRRGAGPPRRRRLGEHLEHGGPVDVAVLREAECERGPRVEHVGAFRAGEGATHPHEAARHDRPAGPVVPVPFERDGALHAAQVERHDEPAVRRELLEPRGRQVPHADRRDDPVVGRPLLVPARAVAGDDEDVGAAGRVEVLPRSLDGVAVEVDAGHLAVLTDDATEQRGVEPGAGADLQHALAAGDAELVQHDRHDRRLRRRADRLAVAVAFGHDRLVQVHLVRRQVGQEQVSRDGAQCVGDEGIDGAALLPHLGKQVLPQRIQLKGQLGLRSSCGHQCCHRAQGHSLAA